MRIVSWNVEDLTPWLEPEGGLDLGAHLELLGAPDVLCLQEVKIRPGDAASVAKMRRLVPGYDVAFSLADDPRNVRFRGGRAHGVATFVRRSLGPFAAAAPSWDREGRVVVTALASGLFVANVYAVNGTSRPYFDPETGAPAGDRHAHKRAFQDRLFDLLDPREPVVAVGDFNVSQARADVTPRLRTEGPHARARAELAAHCARTGFVDVFRRMHPDARSYSWFGRTRAGALDAARVDFALVSPPLVDRVVGADILDEPARRPRSDHAPISVDLAPA